MADADNMVHVAQCKLQHLVGQNACSICKAKQGVIRKDGPQSHCPAVQYGFLAQTTETCMAMHNLDLLSYHNISEDWEEREDGGEGGSAVYDKKWNVVDLEAIREVADAGSSFVGVGDDDDFVTAVDQLG